MVLELARPACCPVLPLPRPRTGRGRWSGSGPPPRRRSPGPRLPPPMARTPGCFLLQVMNDRAVEMQLRIEAAKALLPYFEGERP